MGKQKDSFWNSLFQNKSRYLFYIERLCDLAISLFEWRNLPETVNIEYLEKSLFYEGQAIFVKDEIMGYLGLHCMQQSQLNVYGEPFIRRAYGSNGYNMTVNAHNSVIIYNNMSHTNSFPMIKMYALRLADIDSTIDINSHNQKTPLLITCDESQRMSMLQMYQKYDGNQPVIFGTKQLDDNSIKSIKTEVEFIGNELNALKQSIWNEALTYLGIAGINFEKSERLTADEVRTMATQSITSVYSKLEMRRKACEMINKMFGLNMQVDFRNIWKINGGEVNE